MSRSPARSLFPLLLLLGALPAEAFPPTLPAGFIATQITAISNPTAMAIAPDGRVFVSQQGGTLRVIDKNDVLLPTPFATRTVSSSGERGLLGVAFDPNFATNQFVYIYETTSAAPIHNRVVRLTANGDVAVPGSDLVLLDLDTLGPTNHNGGGLHFGPDGKLYASAGENGTPANAQSFATVLGKILRINSDGTIPTDNPFYGTTTGANRAIWALGLRNPFTFDFQPGTGRMFINDVGEGTWEEIDDGLAGKNYGWPTVEGPAPPGVTGMTYPIFSYAHTGGGVTGCAIVGAAFYNPTTPTFPADYQGKFFYSDYCTGFIRRLDPTTTPATDTDFVTNIASPVDLRVAASGDLYYLAQGDGLVRIHYQGPVILTNPANKTVTAGETASFSVVASGDGVLTYQWQGNTTDILGATSSSYTTPATILGDNGATFRCVVTNGVSNVTSNSATLTVQANQAPTANAQSVSTNPNTAKAITLTGSDPEGGALTFAVVALPANGVLSGTAPNLIYTPATNYSGSDSFTFQVTDPLNATSAPATVSITVTPNQPPTADGQSVTTNEDTAKAITLTGSDPEGGALTFAVLTQPGHGVLSGTAPSLTYTPSPNYNGPDSFTFQVMDPLSATSAPATVSITVISVNDPPVASFTVTPNSGAAPLSVSFDASASFDPDGTIASYAWDFGDGTTGSGVTTAHDYAYAGAYVVTLTVVDDQGAPAQATRPVSVQPAGGKTAAYYTVTPCRLLDTREPNGPGGGPPLAAGQSRTLAIVGRCGVPANATAVFLNVTVVAASAPGFMKVFASGSPLPPTSALNYVIGQIRANNGVYALGAAGLDIFLGQASGTANATVDIAGYFAE